MWVRARLCKLQKGYTRLASASDKVYQLLSHGRWFSLGTPASSITKTGCHDIAEKGNKHNKSNQIKSLLLGIKLKKKKKKKYCTGREKSSYYAILITMLPLLNTYHIKQGFFNSLRPLVMYEKNLPFVSFCFVSPSNTFATISERSSIFYKEILKLPF